MITHACVFSNFQVELNILGRQGVKLYHDDFRFERLEVDASLASQMFEDNRFKSQQIPLIAAQSESGSRITLYRMGEHIDMSRGPLISSTNHIGRFNITAVHTDFCFVFPSTPPMAL